MILVTWVCDTSDMAFSPKGVILVLSIIKLILLSRYIVAIREHNSCLYRICKKNIFCSKYMIICNYLMILAGEGKDRHGRMPVTCMYLYIC